jgi:hypothetical protein
MLWEVPTHAIKFEYKRTKYGLTIFPQNSPISNFMKICPADLKLFHGLGRQMDKVNRTGAL